MVDIEESLIRKKLTKKELNIFDVVSSISDFPRKRIMLNIIVLIKFVNLKSPKTKDLIFLIKLSANFILI